MMSDVSSVTCPHEGEGEVRSSYLAGRLSESDAKAFEAHYFECDRCAEAVTLGTKLRAAFGRTPVAPAAISPSPSRAWLPLAAVIAVALLGFGVWRIARREAIESAPSVPRAAHEALAIDVARAAEGGFTLTWRPPPGAASYKVEVFGADGGTLWSGESREPRLRIRGDDLRATGGAPPPQVQVEAFDAMGQMVARSAPMRLAPSGGRP